MKINFRCDWKNIVFGVYFFFVLITSAWYGSTGGAVNSFTNVSLWTMLIFCTVFLLVPKINRGVKKILFYQNEFCSSKNKLRVFFTTTGVAFLVSFVWFLGSFPGSFSPDSISQYSQAISGHYNDWHPVFHTLLFFKLPLRITGGWIPSIVLFQIVYFSFLMGYFSLTIFRYSSLRFMLISFVAIVFSPFTLEILMYPWKDTAFAFASCLCMIFAVQIYFTKGEWCKTWRIVLFAFVLVCATLFRHNAILFTFFLLASLFFFMPKKKYFMLCVIFIFFLGMVKIPLYSVLHVEKPNKRVLETMGLPLSVISNVAKIHPERLNEETADFMEKLVQGNGELLKSYHISGFNSIKWSGLDYSQIEEKGVCGILRMMFHCVRVAPKTSAKAAIGVTIPVYGIVGTCRAGDGISENNFGLEARPIKLIAKLKRIYAAGISHTPLKYVFSCIGSVILVMFAFILFKTDFTKKEDWKRIFLCLAIFTYDFGTMLFLSGSDVRFFFVTFLVWPLIVLVMSRKFEVVEN